MENWASRRAAVMVLLEGSGVRLNIFELSHLAEQIMSKTGGDPAGALLGAAHLSDPREG